MANIAINFTSHSFTAETGKRQWTVNVAICGHMARESERCRDQNHQKLMKLIKVEKLKINIRSCGSGSNENWYAGIIWMFFMHFNLNLNQLTIAVRLKISKCNSKIDFIAKLAFLGLVGKYLGQKFRNEVNWECPQCPFSSNLNSTIEQNYFPFLLTPFLNIF